MSSRGVVPQIVKIVDASGAPVPGAKAYFFIAGSNIPASVRTSADGVTAHPVPLVADAAGVLAPFFLDDDVEYKIDVYTANDVQVDGYPIEPLVGIVATSRAAEDIAFTPTEDILQTDLQSAVAFLGASQAAAPFANRTDAIAEDIDETIDSITVLSPSGRLLDYRRDASGTALTTADGGNWSPAGVGTPDHWAENTTPGTTDMTTAITAAAAFGDVLFSGTYLVTATVPIPSNRTLTGETSSAQVIASDDAWVRYEAIASAVEKGGFTSNSKPMFSNTDPTSGNENITIQDLTLTGSLTGSNHILHVRAVDNLTIRRLRTNEGLSPLAILRCTDVSIVDNRVSGFRNGGIDTWEGCKRVVISRNHIDCDPTNPDGSNIGIFVTAQPTDSTDAETHFAEDYTVTDNIITAPDGSGIWIGGGATTRGNDEVRRISVTTNSISDADDVGIIVEQGQRVSIVENIIRGIGSHGILARRLGASGPPVEDLRVSGNFLKDVGMTDAASRFVSLDDETLFPVITDNVGRGTTHEYALYNRGTNTGLTHHGNRWDTGTAGIVDDSGIDTRNVPPGGVTLETTWDAGLVANGAQVSTTVSLPGVALKDSVWVTANSPFSGMHLWAEVTATDTVTLYLTNNTGGDLDPSVRSIFIRANRFLT